jgi:hypothetical protein
MKNIIVLSLLSVAVFVPSITHAFDVTDRSITKLSDTLTMYTITFNAGFLNADLWIPIAASQNDEDDKKGKIYSIVLSKETLDERMYHVTKKERGEFMLVVFEDVPPGVERSKTLTITDIPHQIQREGEERAKRSLTEEELKGFAVARR